MKPENMNLSFLEKSLNGQQVDVYYHFGVDSSSPVLELLRDVQAVVMAGSGERIDAFSRQWSRLNDDAEVIEFPKEDRFVTRYCAGVLFASHGMGMPSASIAVQELMRMLYFLKRGDLTALQEVFWCRVGTSGGVGLPGGHVVVATEGLMPDLQPYRLMLGREGHHWFDGTFPAGIVQEIIQASAESADLHVVPGKTIAANEFFVEQFRLDGAINLGSEQTKAEWLAWLHDNGVRNIEMEGAMLAGYLNHWGFPRFAMICSTLLNRLEGDQITSTPEELQSYSEASGRVLFNYLLATVAGRH